MKNGNSRGKRATKKLHPVQRHAIILELLKRQGVVSRAELLEHTGIAPATLMRDVSQLHAEGRLRRFRGGVQHWKTDDVDEAHVSNLVGEVDAKKKAARESIGRAASALCKFGDAVVIGGGSTTLSMCPYLEPLELHVLTNSLDISNALVVQPKTHVTLTGGVILHEHRVVVDLFESEPLAGFHGSRTFLGAGAVNGRGLLYNEAMLACGDRRLSGYAENLVVLAESSAFRMCAAHKLFDLRRLGTIVTDTDIDDATAKMLVREGINLIIVDPIQ